MIWKVRRFSFRLRAISKDFADCEVFRRLKRLKQYRLKNKSFDKRRRDESRTHSIIKARLFKATISSTRISTIVDAKSSKSQHWENVITRDEKKRTKTTTNYHSHLLTILIRFDEFDKQYCLRSNCEHI